MAQQNPTTEVNYPERIKKANTTVRYYTLGSVVVGFIPLPVVDLAALTAVELKMLHSLAKQYHVPFSRDLGKSIISSLLGGVLVPSGGSVPLSSLVKVVPLVGQAAGMVSTAVLGGAATYAVGQVFIQHFESGGTFLTFDPEKVRKYFAEEFEKGKTVVAEMKQGGAA
jgi:uncharacterized protein (DUF697 family)